MRILSIGFCCLILSEAISAAPYQMTPIISHRPIARKTPSKRPVVKRAAKVTKKAPQAPTLAANPVQEALRNIHNQIMATRTETAQLISKKQVLLDAFTKTQAAFIFKLPSAQETQPQESLLLALDSSSTADFVHRSVMLPYLTKYLVQKNQQCANLLRNLQQINNDIRANIEKEQQLINQWYAQNAAAQKNSSAPLGKR